METVTHIYIMGSIKTLCRNLQGTISIPLLLLFLVSIFSLSLTSDSSLIRDAFCDKGVCFRSSAPTFWNEILRTFAAGGAITILFYWILVRRPEHLRRQRVKRNLAVQYKAFKISCIENFLAVADGGFPSELPKELLPVAKFRDYFNQDIGDNKRRWHDVANNMTGYYLDVTLSRMEILRQEISLAMHVIDFSEKDAYDILKRLSHTFLMQRDATRDYDSIKSFLGVFWELFAGWDLAKGYRDIDLIEEIIDSI